MRRERESGGLELFALGAVGFSERAGVRVLARVDRAFGD